MIGDAWELLRQIVLSDAVAQTMVLLAAFCVVGALLCLADTVRARFAWPRRRERRRPVLTTPQQHRRLQELRLEARRWQAKRWLSGRQPLLITNDLPAVLRRQAG